VNPPGAFGTIIVTVRDGQSLALEGVEVAAAITNATQTAPLRRDSSGAAVFRLVNFIDIDSPIGTVRINWS